MKKVITIVMILITIMLTSCVGGKPTDISEDAYNKALEIVRVADFYDDGTYDSSNASTLIGMYFDDFSAMDDSSNTYLNLLLEIPRLRDYIADNNVVAYKAQLDQIKEKLGLK